MSNSLILHIAAASCFHSLSDTEPYLPAEFAADGFIHCTKEPDVMLQIANRFYKDVMGDVLVLVIDADRVTSEVKWEPPVHPDGSLPPPTGARLFPHIYGPLNREAIVEIRTATRAADGAFFSV